MSTPTTIIEVETGAVAAVSKLPPDEARNKKKADSLVALAQAMEVKTPEDYEFAAAELRTIIGFHSELEEERVSYTGPINTALTRLNARFMPYLKALRGDGKKDTVSAESIIKGKMAAFTAEQERIAAEQRRQAELAAEAERRRLAAEAEKLRREAEDKRLAEEAAERQRQEAARAEQKRLDDIAANSRSAKLRKEAEERAAAQRLVDEEAERVAKLKREADAQLAEQQAQALEQTAAVVIAQPTAAVVTRVAGIAGRKVVDYNVTDKAAFLRYVLDQRPDLLDVVELNATQMRRFIGLAGVRTVAPGLDVFEKTSLAVR